MWEAVIHLLMGDGASFMVTGMRHTSVSLIVAAALCWVGRGVSAASPPEAANSPLYVSWGFEQHQLTDQLGRRVTYYMSHAAKAAPLLLAIQGSGCDQLFPSERNPSGVYNTWPPSVSTASDGRFTVIVVEKPFAQPQRAMPHLAETCGQAFNADFSADRWLVALLAALKDAETSAWVKKGDVFVLGHSEGAPMAALVASHAPEVAGLAYLAGPGDTQAYDTILAAYGRGKTDAERVENVEKAEAAIRWITSHPNDTSHFPWGHTPLRWSSFYKLSSINEMLHSKARIYLGSGTADQNEPFWSTQIAAARLLVEGREFTNHIVPSGDHSFRTPDDKDPNRVVAEYRRALDWLLPR